MKSAESNLLKKKKKNAFPVTLPGDGVQWCSRSRSLSVFHLRHFLFLQITITSYASRRYFKDVLVIWVYFCPFFLLTAVCIPGIHPEHLSLG